MILTISTQQALATPMMVSLLAPDPNDEFRRLASGLLPLTPTNNNPRGWEHVSLALQEPTSLLVATSESGHILAALAYRDQPDGTYVRMLGATGIVKGAATVLLCALAEINPECPISAAITPDATGYYAKLGWQPVPSLFDIWAWPLECSREAAELFRQSSLRLVYSGLPDIAYDLVDLEV